MKKYLSMLAIALASLTFTGCDDDSCPPEVMYFPIITLEGDEVEYATMNTGYTLPGYSATLNGEDCTSQIKVTIYDVIADEVVTNIDPNNVGYYRVTYSGTNEWGYSSSVQRVVYVFNPEITESIAGKYNTDMEESFYKTGSGWKTFADMAASYGNTTQCTGIVFTEIVPGFFQCNDLFAGWYGQIRGYAATNGTRYNMTGYVSLNPDNSLTLLTSLVAGWGDGLDYLDDGQYDPETGTITYNLGYASAIYMDITLNKQ